MTKSKIELPIEILRQLLDYDPKTGILTWKERPVEFFKSQGDCNAWNGKNAGKRAFTADTGNGYYNGKIFGVKYTAHRVGYALYHGEWPNYIDHINGIRNDNRIANLRSVTVIENNRNSKLQSNNTSGVCGVVWCKWTKKWRAMIHNGQKKLYLGRHLSFEEAVAARKAAEIEHGYSERHGT